MRQADLLARYGGEEFAAVLPETARPGALELAEQIRKLVADDPVEFEGRTIPVTVSVGIAVLESKAAKATDSVDPYAIILVADDMLSEAKRGGRNRVAG
jgi:diguanylate cyclase (GGDEF)-like protein